MEMGRTSEVIRVRPNTYLCKREMIQQKEAKKNQVEAKLKHVRLATVVLIIMNRV